MKSAVLNYLNGCQMKGIEIHQADVAASFQQAVIDVLVGNVEKALEETGMKKFAIAGGVASNGTLRNAMEQACAKRGVAFYRPSPILCTDNAAMIGAAAMCIRDSCYRCYCCQNQVSYPLSVFCLQSYRVSCHCSCRYFSSCLCCCHPDCYWYLHWYLVQAAELKVQYAVDRYLLQNFQITDTVHQQIPENHR